MKDKNSIAYPKIAEGKNRAPALDKSVPEASSTTTEPISATKPARCLVLTTPEGVKAGIALYFYNYSTWRAKAGIYL